MTVRRPFVVLHHTGNGAPHYDLLLDVTPDAPLPTWRCPAWPIADGSVATPIPAHRRVYLTFEGPLSGGRGHVRRVAAGTFEFQEQTPAELVVVIDGQILKLLKFEAA